MPGTFERAQAKPQKKGPSSWRASVHHCSQLWVCTDKEGSVLVTLAELPWQGNLCSCEGSSCYKHPRSEVHLHTLCCWLNLQVLQRGERHGGNHEEEAEGGS